MKLSNLWNSLYSQKYKINFLYYNQIYHAKSYKALTGVLKILSDVEETKARQRIKFTWDSIIS